MKILILFVGIIAILASSSIFALEFTENTTFSDKNVNYKFIQNTSLNSFEIVSNGMLIDDKQKYEFVVAGGELDVSFYGNNVIGLRASAPQNIIFKITQDDKKMYLKEGDNYFIDDIYVGINEKLVSPVLYKSGQTEFSDTIQATIKKQEWWQRKLFMVEIEKVVDSDGVIQSRTWGISYFTAIVISVMLLLFGWFTRGR